MSAQPWDISLRVLQHAPKRIGDTLERKYNRHTRIELVRRAVERESDNEIREAIRGIST